MHNITAVSMSRDIQSTSTWTILQARGYNIADLQSTRTCIRYSEHKHKHKHNLQQSAKQSTWTILQARGYSIAEHKNMYNH